MRSPGWVRATRVLASCKAAQGVVSHAFQSLLFITVLLLIPYAVDPLFKNCLLCSLAWLKMLFPSTSAFWMQVADSAALSGSSMATF